MSFHESMISWITFNPYLVFSLTQAEFVHIWGKKILPLLVHFSWHLIMDPSEKSDASLIICWCVHLLIGSVQNNQVQIFNSSIWHNGVFSWHQFSHSFWNSHAMKCIFVATATIIWTFIIDFWEMMKTLSNSHANNVSNIWFQLYLKYMEKIVELYWEKTNAQSPFV